MDKQKYKRLFFRVKKRSYIANVYKIVLYWAPKHFKYLTRFCCCKGYYPMLYDL